MSIDKFLDRSYHARDYNCLHFAREVWLDLTGQDLTQRFHSLWAPLASRTVTRAVLGAFRRLPVAVSPCLVLMRTRNDDPHMGVYVDGRVLHIHRHGVGFEALDIATLGYKLVRFYK